MAQVAQNQDEPRWTASPVEGIAPVDGWTLLETSEDDSDGFTTTLYIARGPDRDVVLNASRFGFTPTQERFAWFVRHDLPRLLPHGPFSNRDVDMMIALEAIVVRRGA